MPKAKEKMLRVRMPKEKVKRRMKKEEKENLEENLVDLAKRKEMIQMKKIQKLFLLKNCKR